METRLYKAGAVQSIPSMSSLTSEGFPTSGNPTAGIAATKPGDAWFYGIGEEIRNVILAAGLVPSNNALDQLAQAIQMLAAKHGFQTGDVKPLISNTITDGFLLGNSAVVNRSVCTNLVEYAYDNGYVRTAEEQAAFESNPETFDGPIYGPGDGSTTIQLPDFRGRSLMGAMSSARVGRYQPEQLPNINGNLYSKPNSIGSGSQSSGAFSMYTDGDQTETASVLSQRSASRRWNFAASKSNSTYTNNGKVYPLSLALNFIIKC